MILSRRTTISLVLGAIGLVLLFVAPLAVRRSQAWIEADRRAEEAAQAQLWTRLAPLEQKLFEAATGGPPVSGATVLLPVTAPAPTPAPGNSIESSAEQP